jgi:Flp pilus assembly pilin Flp
MAKKFSQSASRSKQLGQGMTEYIIIVALIAVAAIGIYGIFGDTIRAQMGSMTGALAGNASVANSNRTAVNADATKAGTEGVKNKTMNSFEK